MSRYLGQHFLKNTAVIKKIIAAIDPQPDETIIEVGPGHGELTIPLAAACAKVGAQIVAVEKDVKLAKALRAKIEDLEIDGSKIIEVAHSDVLQFLETEKAAGRFARAPFKFVGNIPYYLTGHLLRTVGELAMEITSESSLQFACAVFMVQKEVAERLCAVPPRMNRLAASVQFWAEPKIIARIPREDFTPPPEVDSAVIKLAAKGHPKAVVTDGANLTADCYYAAMRTLFAQPRKTILNNLSAISMNRAHKTSQTNGKMTREKVSEALKSLGIDPKLRPQDLTIKNIAQIADALFCA